MPVMFLGVIIPQTPTGQEVHRTSPKGASEVVSAR